MLESDISFVNDLLRLFNKYMQTRVFVVRMPESTLVTFLARKPEYA